MGEYQEMAVKVYHSDESSYAAKQIAKEILINSGWSQQDIEGCNNQDPKTIVMVLLA